MPFCFLLFLFITFLLFKNLLIPHSETKIRQRAENASGVQYLAVVDNSSLYFSSGRANNAADINTKLSKQCRIWSEISEKISDFNVKSFTNSVDQIYKKKKVNVEEIVNFFKIPSEAVGIALGINHQLVNIDIFSKFNDILNPNGFLFFEVPNCPKEYFQGRPYDSPHLLFFTSKSMHKIAKMHNMEFVNFSYSSYSFDDDHKYQRESQNLYEELNKSKFSSAKIKQILKKIVPNSLINLRRNFLEKRDVKNEERANWFASNTGDNCYIRGILKKKI